MTRLVLAIVGSCALYPLSGVSRKEPGMTLTKHLWYQNRMQKPSLRTFEEALRPLARATGASLSGTSLNFLIRISGQASMIARTCAPLLKSNNVCSYCINYQGFFTIYRNLFTRLAQEENLISEIEYPSFGDVSWTWSAPKSVNQPAARDFYNAWINFATLKDFIWIEQWNLAEAPDRRVRR